MGLLRNLARGALQRALPKRPSAAAGIGGQFSAGQDRAMAELDAGVESAFQLIGAAVVSTWEVLLTDAGRALVGQLPEADRAAVLTRLSDALVPTQERVQAGGRALRAAVKSGTQAGLRSGQLAEATAPLLPVVRGLGAQVAEGWASSVAYLEPALARMDDPAALSERFSDLGPAIRSHLDIEAERFVLRIEALPEAAALGPALQDALDAWQKGVSRAFEVELYGARTALVESAARIGL